MSFQSASQKKYPMALFEQATLELGCHPYPAPAATLSETYTNPDGITRRGAADSSPGWISRRRCLLGRKKGRVIVVTSFTTSNARLLLLSKMGIHIIRKKGTLGRNFTHTVGGGGAALIFSKPLNGFVYAGGQATTSTDSMEFRKTRAFYVAEYRTQARKRSTHRVFRPHASWRDSPQLGLGLEESSYPHLKVVDELLG